MENYDEIRQALRPRHDIKASCKLRDRIADDIDKATNKTSGKWVYWLGASMAAAMLALIFVPSGMSAKGVLDSAINYLKGENNIEMTVEIRTSPTENFSFIDTNADFVTHQIDISRADTTSCWRIDKGERIAVGNGYETFVWLERPNTGWRSAKRRDEILGFISILLTPEKILQSELDQCLSNDEAEYSITKDGNEVRLTVHAQPQGDFTNPYKLNTSIPESKNIRRYTFDAETKRLRGASVSMIKDGREITVLKISQISYGAYRPLTTRIPSDIRFVDIDKRPAGLPDLNAAEAAARIINAFKSWDRDILDKVIEPSISDSIYKAPLKGAVLLSVGQPFSSGNDSSTTFVPYRLRLRDGNEMQHNMALSKNEAGNWIFSGGL